MMNGEHACLQMPGGADGVDRLFSEAQRKGKPVSSKRLLDRGSDCRRERSRSPSRLAPKEALLDFSRRSRRSTMRCPRCVRRWPRIPAPCWSRRPAPARPRASRSRSSTSPGRRASASSCSSRAVSPPAPPPPAWRRRLGEKVGETIGLRVRLHSLVSKRTRIEVVTEGVFTRMILDDPALEGVAAVLFDEFHERSLDADLGLAFALDAQQAPCARTCAFLSCRRRSTARGCARCCGDAPLIESQGRAFPVATRYVGRNPGARIEDEVARVTLDALASEQRLDPGLPAGAGRNPARRGDLASARARAPCRHCAALWRARRPCAGSRHRARARGAAQDRARHLDRRDVAHHRRRARRDRFRASCAFRSTSPTSA